jgi:hypothetical protein
VITPSVIDSKGHNPSRYRRVKADKAQATGFKGIARGRERRTPIDIQANGKKDWKCEVEADERQPGYAPIFQQSP